MTKWFLRFKQQRHDNYLVLSQAVPRYMNKLFYSEKLASNPYSQFFNQMNPDYTQGKALLVFVELNFMSFIFGISKCLKNIIIGER